MPKKTSEEKRIPLTPEDLLRQHKEDVAKVYRVWAPGESDFGPYETILYVTEGGVARTAVLVDDTVILRDTWDHFNVQFYV